MPVGGIVVMEHQGNGNYSGYWARSCTSNKRYQIPAPVYSSEAVAERRETAKGKMTKCWGYICNVNPVILDFKVPYYLQQSSSR